MVPPVADPVPSVSRSQRLVNLVIALMATPEYQSADRLRRSVQGYEDCDSDQAFLRRFERDKKALREAGVPIEQGDTDEAGSPPGYRVSAADYQLPEIAVSPEQAAILGVAAHVWRDARRQAAASGALTKLAATGIAAPADAAPPVDVAAPAELALAAEVAEAIGERRVVEFAYAPSGAVDTDARRVEPWWTGSRDGRWYLVGFDLDRGAPRTFRLVRMSDLRATRTPCGRAVPPAAAVATLLEESIARVDPPVDARVVVAEGHGALLRARGTVLGSTAHGDEIAVTGSVGEIAALVAGLGPDAVVLGPDELRERVVTILTAAAAWAPGEGA